MRLHCHICGSQDIETIVSSPLRKKESGEVGGFSPTSPDFGIFYGLAQCKKCRIVFSLVDEKTIVDARKLYSDVKDDLYLSQEAERSLTYQKVITHIKDFVPGKARLLDIGCSYGFFLKAAKEHGLQTDGVELSREACKYCRQTWGIDVFCGEVGEAGFPENHFDIVTAIEVIEHLADPKAFLSQVKRILKPGGILYLVTPNLASLSSRILRYRWWSYREMHLYYFSRKTINGFLNNNGFSVLSTTPYKKTFRLNYIMRQFNQIGYSKAISKSLSGLKKLIEGKNFYVTASFGDMAVTAKKRL